MTAMVAPVDGHPPTPAVQPEDVLTNDPPSSVKTLGEIGCTDQVVPPSLVFSGPLAPFASLVVPIAQAVLASTPSTVRRPKVFTGTGSATQVVPPSLVPILAGPAES